MLGSIMGANWKKRTLLDGSKLVPQCSQTNLSVLSLIDSAFPIQSQRAGFNHGSELKKNLLDGRKLVPQHFPIQWDAHWYPGTLPNPMGCRSQKNLIFENFISPRPDLYIEPKTKNRRRDLGQSLKHISCFWKNTCSPCETGCFAPEHFYYWILLPSAQSL